MEEINMNTYNLSNAKIYVFTYGKYNNCSLFGAWLALSDYADKEDFYEACRELHKDEEDAEFMFQDWENVPEGLISESYISEKFFDLRDELDNLTDTEKDAFWTWVNYIVYNIADNDVKDLVNEFKDSYVGEYEDEEAFSFQIVEECYDLPGFAKTYFDYKKFSRDLFMCDYYYDNGFVFQR